MGKPYKTLGKLKFNSKEAYENWLQGSQRGRQASQAQAREKRRRREASKVKPISRRLALTLFGKRPKRARTIDQQKASREVFEEPTEFWADNINKTDVVGIDAPKGTKPTGPLRRVYQKVKDTSKSIITSRDTRLGTLYLQKAALAIHQIESQSKLTKADKIALNKLLEEQDQLKDSMALILNFDKEQREQFLKYDKKLRELRDTKGSKPRKKATSPKKTSPKKSSAKLPITVKETDLDLDTAARAYQWAWNINMTAEEKGKREQKIYVNAIEEMYNKLKPFVRNKEQEKILKEELERYRKGYINKRLSILHRRSKMASTVVTGTSNFPFARQEKLQARDRKAHREFYEWQGKVEASIRRKLKRETTTEEKLSDLQRDVLRNIRSANTFEYKGEKVPSYHRPYAKNSIFSRIETLARNGQVEEVKKMLKFVKENQTLNLPKGKRVAFSDKHKIWNLEERAKRIRQKQKENVGKTKLRTFPGGKIINNKDEERIQIFFENEPPENVRQLLKDNGWRWSGRNNAWQRKNTTYAESSVVYFLNRYEELKKEQEKKRKST